MALTLRIRLYPDKLQDTEDVRMQGMLAAAAGLIASPLLPEHVWALPANKAQAVDVGTYLPPAGVEDFVQFVVSKDKTPVRSSDGQVLWVSECRDQPLIPSRLVQVVLCPLFTCSPVCSGH